MLTTKTKRFKNFFVIGYKPIPMFVFMLSFICTVLISSAFSDTTTALTARWKLDEGGSATTTYDAVSSRAGNLRNGPVWISGKTGNALQFDKTNDYVRITDFSYHTSKGRFSLTVWFRITSDLLSPTTTYSLLGHGSLGTRKSLTVYLKNDTLRTYLLDTLNNPGKTALDITGMGTYANDQWHLYSLCADSANVKVYLDGVQKSSSTNFLGGSTNRYNPADSILIGRMKNGSTNYAFGGKLDEIRFFSRALSSLDVYELYTGLNPRRQDSLALVALYNSTNGGTSWNLQNPINTWSGVTVTNNRVAGINLYDLRLPGTIPPELGSLSNLIEINFNKNQFSGQIPPQLGNLTNLEILALGGNNLTGVIPPELGSLSKLKTLELLVNQLEGPIPSSFSGLINLERLQISVNFLTGNLPVNFGNLTKLTQCYLNNNRLTGLPDDITNITGLVELDLGYNQFCTLSPAVVAWANQHDPDWASAQECPEPQIQITATPQSGPVPLTVNFTATNIGQSNIDTWAWNFGDGDGDVSNEQNPSYTYYTTGTFTAQVTAAGIGGTTTESITIEAIDVLRRQDSLALVALYNSANGQNWIRNTNWLTTQPIDSWEGITVTSNRVEGIDLTDNNLLGSLPAEIGNLTDLKVLQLNTNQVSGQIPHELYTLLKLRDLNLGRNALEGTIPPDIGNLRSLRILRLYINNFTGTIPEELGNLESLESFWCAGNQFENLPNSIVNLSGLTNCLIKNNKFCTLSPTLITWANEHDPEWSATQDCPDMQIQVTATPQIGPFPLTVHFTATNTGEGNIESWSWNFGDGGTSTEQNPTHIYTTEGAFWAEVRADYLGRVKIEGITIETFDALRRQDSLALVALYNSTDGPNWTNKTNWLTLEPIDTWFGVTVANNRVFSVYLGSEDRNNLQGVLPNEIGNLTAVTQLVFEYNSLVGSIPSSIGNLINLDCFIIGNNLMSGAIPDEIGNLIKLNLFDISDNEFTNLPASITNNVRPQNVCDLGGNRFCTLSPTVTTWANQYDPDWASTQNCPEPQIQITATPQSGPIPLTVNFAATNIGQSNIDTWSWVFGDGGTSTEQNPTHVYSASGTFTAQVTAAGIGGSTTDSVVIQAVVPPPSITISAEPQSGEAPFYVHFTAINSGGPVSSWVWFFGDGDSSTEQNPTHTYILWGTYIVQAIATGSGGYSTDTIFIEVTVRRPYVTISAEPQAGAPPLTVNFTVINDGGPDTAWMWEFGDGGTSTERNPTHIFTNTGLFNVQLTATGPGGVDIQTKTIDVFDDPRRIDSLALVVLYGYTDGSNWTNNTNWLSGQSIDTWYGITVLNNRVSEIILSNNQLTGYLPTELNNLVSLRWLDLRNNQLTGAVSPALSDLVSLQGLQLDHNQLTGAIPPELGALSNLLHLSISNNQLTGSIPPEIGNLINLQVLYLSSNQITGSIPTELENLHNLRILGLGQNQLAGPIPLELGNLNNLEQLDLGTNQLTGPIPSVLGNLTNLSDLSIGGTLLAGLIPHEIGNLINLKRLILCSNQLSGPIPSEIGNLNNLEYLSLFNNSLTGTIPLEIGNLSNLLFLELQVNQFTGDIPAEIGNLNQLQLFSIHYNQFTNLPVEIVNINQIQGCELGYNQFCSLSPTVATWASQYDPDWASTQDCPQPEIQISATPESGPVPLTVNFTATNIGQSNIDTWSWTFGDGGTSTEQNPTHIYNTAGVFTARLIATGIGGADTESIVISPYSPPVVTITANPRSGEAPLMVTFTAVNTGGPVGTWAWDFGDGSNDNVQNPPPHTYAAVGTYIVTVTATNAAGSSTDTDTIRVSPATATLTMTATGVGTTSPTLGDTQVVQGVDVPIIATPATGYEFIEWTVTQGSATVAQPTQSSTTVQLSGNATINAHFAIINYTLTLSSGQNGAVEPSGPITVQHGVPIQVVAIPDEGYHFALWSVVNGTAIIENPTADTTNVILQSGDAEIAAAFVTDENITPYNRMLSITGTLYDEYGTPIGYPDPMPVNASIRLITDKRAGDTVYTETFYEENNQAVVVANGLFVARLGSGTSVNNLQSVLSAYQNLFVEISVENGTPDVLLPRTPLTAGPYALTAPSQTEFNLNTIHGSGNPNDKKIQGRMGMYYIDDENGTTWLRIQAKWVMLD